MVRIRTACLSSFAALLFAGSACAASAEAPADAATRPEPKALAVRANLHVLAGLGGNVAVWSGPDGIVLVDSGEAASSAQLIEAVGRIATGPVRFVVDTQWHPDHSGGNEALARAGAVVLAQDAVRARLGEAQSLPDSGQKVPAAPKSALPTITFADALALNLNGDRLSASHAVGAQTDGDVVVWWEAANVVHVGDLFCNGSYPMIDLASGGSLAGMVAAIELVLERADARTVVIPGHGALAGRSELAAYRDMLVAVGRRVRQMVEQGKSEEEILASHPTAEFDERYAAGLVTPERFVRIVYADLAGRR